MSRINADLYQVLQRGITGDFFEITSIIQKDIYLDIETSRASNKYNNSQEKI